MPKKKPTFEEYKAQFKPEQLTTLKNPERALRAGYSLNHGPGLTTRIARAKRKGIF